MQQRKQIEAYRAAWKEAGHQRDRQLTDDEAIAAADTLLLTVPNQLGVEYNAHAIGSILRYVATELGWR